VDHLDSQVIEGLVVDSARGTPVGRGFVVLLDPFGVEVDRALSGSDGRFNLRALTGGAYVLRSERIGFRAVESDLLQLAHTDTLRFTLHVAALPIKLATLVVRERDHCNTNPADGERTLLIWEEIRKALAATSWGDEQELFRYRQYTYHRMMNRRRTRTLEETGRTKSGLTDSPFRSAPPEVLAREGYITERDDGTWYLIPDAHTLLDDDFLSTHCFHVVRDQRNRTGEIGLAFEPTSGRDLPDVEGTLWLDENSAELRELEVRHTGVSFNLRDRRIGGTVRFLMLPSGAWIVREWQVRTPAIEVTEHPNYMRGRKAEVVGFMDTGGEILRISARDGSTVYEASLSIISGSVFDSTSSRYLGGALVGVAGTDFRTITDANGRFELHVPFDGEYSVALEHPKLDSVAAPPEELAVDLMRGAETYANFNIPHVRSAMERLCPASDETPDSRMVFGVVRDSATGTPVVGARVFGWWQSIRIWRAAGGRPRTAPVTQDWGDKSGLTVSVHDVSEEVTTDRSGWYAVCHVPAGRTIWLLAEKDGATSREASFIFPKRTSETLLFGWNRPRGAHYQNEFATDQPAWKVDFFLAPDRLAESAPSPPRLVGLVTDSVTGEPLEGVTVIADGQHRTATGSEGRYELSGVTWPDSLVHIEVSRLGYGAAQVALQVVSHEPETLLNFSLSPLPIQLEEVVIEGDRGAGYFSRISEFEHRRETMIGTFFSRDDIEERQPHVITDLIGLAPGVEVFANIMGNNVIRMTSARFSGCNPAIYVDGTEVKMVPIGFNPKSGSPIYPDMIVDQFVDANDVAAVEIYTSAANVPPEFMAVGSDCGVIAIWMR